MTNSNKQIIAYFLLSGLLASFASGCKSCCKGVKHSNAAQVTTYFPFPWDPCENPPNEDIIINPDSNGGTLNALIGSFTNANTDGCFPTSAGWDSHYFVTFYFLGPNVSPLPSPNNYPNPDNTNCVTIDTEATQNGTTLDTGI